MAREMAKIELVLLGEPRLMIDGREEKIAPKRAFEVAARIIWAGTASVSRAELQAFFWGHLAEKNAGQQLRLVLLKLRREFARLGIEEFFELDGPVLRLTHPVDVDLQRLASVEPWTFEEAQALLVPVAAGWDLEHWFAQSDYAGDVLARAIQSCSKADAPPEAVIELLTHGCRVHPTCVSLYQQLFALYHKLGREAEANEVIIQFESAWVDRFGTGQIPTLGIGPEAPTIIVRPPAVSPRAPTVPLVVVAVAALIFLIYATLGGNQLGRVPDRPDLKFISSRDVTVDGIDYTVARLQFTGTAVPRFFYLQDGTVGVKVREGAPSYFFRLEGKRVVWDNSASPHLELRLGNLSAFGWGDPVEGLVVTGDQNTFRIDSNANYRQLGAIRLFPSGALCFERWVNEPFRSSRLTYFLRDASSQPVPIQGGLSSQGRPAQVCVVTAMDDRSVYGKFSSGRTDGWTYRTFRFDIESEGATPLDHEPVAAVSSEGDLALQPDASTIDPETGKIATDWDGRVILQSRTGARRPLKWKDRDHFYEFRSVGDLIIVQASKDGMSPNYRVFDFEGNAVSEFDAELKQGWGLAALDPGRGVSILTHNANEFVLIMKRDHR